METTDTSVVIQISQQEGDTLDEKISKRKVDILNGRFYAHPHIIQASSQDESPHPQIGTPLPETFVVLGRTYEPLRIGGNVDYCLRRGCGAVRSSDGCTNEGCIDARHNPLPLLSAVAIKYNLFGRK